MSSLGAVERRPGIGSMPGTVSAPAHGRIEAIDLARGIAVVLMIVSHGVNGLLAFEQFSDAGMLLHAFTKFASSLFIVVFGIALGVAFVPHANTPQWPRRRLKLLLNGLVVLFWYKLLTIVEMNHLYEPQDIVDALLYRQFPSYVEILGFYAIALLWLPFVLPLWARLPRAAQWLSPLVLVVVWWLLLHHFGWFGVPQLQALLVEHRDYYTWGQLSRGPLVLLGLLIGGLVLRDYGDPRRRRRLALRIAGCGALGLLAFVVLAWPALHDALLAVARNAGKHPPELRFMLYSLGGALVLLATALLGGERLAQALRPVSVIGSDALQAFIFHIVVIFVLFRLLFGWFQAVDYGFALSMALLLVGATAAWISLRRWIQQRA